MTTKNIKDATVLELCTKRMQALGRFGTAADTILFNGQEHHVADVVAIYQQCVDARAPVAAARESLTTAIVARRGVDGTCMAADKAVRAWVVARFGEGSTQALAFGFAPVVRRTPSAATKAHAATLARATRKARGTDKGARQRALIKAPLPTDATPSVTPAPGSSANAGATPAGTSGTGTTTR